MTDIPFRQIHLDFHTSPWIRGIGAEFDAQAFVAQLKAARVNSVTIFAKGHHGMSYYPTEVGIVHPEIQKDMMGEMIEACHAAGIRCPIYISVVYDEYAADTHAEWRQIDPYTGKFVGAEPRQPGWKWLCMNTEYRHYVLAQVREICRMYKHIDGFFFDIVKQVEPGCVCNNCVRDMQEMKLDPGDDAQLRWFSLHTARHFMRLVKRAIEDGRHDDATLFFNSRLRIDDMPEAGMPGEADFYTHWEIESLPSGGWGYNHFPMLSRYLQTKDKPMLGMTGRFHRSWGDFGGLKSAPALEYECFRMLAAGAGCSIGDQLHPRGKLDPTTYDLIGQIYSQVESVEPWCQNTTAQAEIGVLAAPIGKGTDPVTDREAINAKHALEGVTRMLLESHQPFHILDRDADYYRYKVLIAPDVIRFDSELADKLDLYVNQGGTLLLSYESGLNPERTAFALQDIGLKFWEDATYTPSYIDLTEVEGEVGQDIPPMEHVIYGPGLRVTSEGATTLANEVEPYFNRTWDHFCSHRQTPPRKRSGAPMITRSGNIIYIARPIFNEYRKYGNRVSRLLVRNLLNMLLPKPLIVTNAPTGAEITLLKQAEAEGRPERHLAHILFYTPERRSLELDLIEDVIPLHDVQLKVRLDRQVTRAYLVPQGQDVAFETNDGYASVTVPHVRGHQIVAFE